MKRILSAVAIMGIIFSSCSSGSSSDVSAIDSTVVPPGSKQPVISDTIVAGAINPQQNATPVTLGSSSGTILPNGTTIPVTTPKVTATAAGMNPPHGEPGHRCDINVGAPLNSKPNATGAVAHPPVQTVQSPVIQPNQPTPQTVQTTITPQQTAATTPTAPGMNPPHGQPNHRCDIAVGAPLNSKPAATPTVTQTPVQQPVNVTPDKPVNVTPAGTTTFTPAGMNPPHGQPNHRCDIAVGAPLNSAPTVKKDSIPKK